mmetsp:Transcript_92006/g.177306  ORF Transcript_92006/g.177306 Transcript_92006/m.177306 type:complete len:514 (+) Transcript_92006:73-1614(+)
MNFFRGNAFRRLPSRSRRHKDGGQSNRSQVTNYNKRGTAGQVDRKMMTPPTDDESNASAATTEADSRTSSTRTPMREFSNASTLSSQKLEARQLEEKEFIRNNDTSEANIWYLVDVRWLQDWKHFVTRNGPMPGAIDNSRLVDRQTGRPRDNLKPVDDYRGVNYEVWVFWHSRYGGGPVIRRKQLDLYAPKEDMAADSSVGIRPEPPALPGATPAATVATSPPAVASTRTEAPQRSHSRLDSRDREEAKCEANSSGSGGGRSAASLSAGHGGQASGRRIGSGGVLASLSSRSRDGDMWRTSSAPASRKPRPKEAPKQLEQTPSKEELPGSLCCDKCDGPHETDKCPYFKKAREKHQDAWSSYGKCKGGKDSMTDTTPILKNARVVPQPADGSCLFHSLSYGLSDKSTASSLRRDISGYIAKNPDMTIADTAIKDWIKYDSNDSVQAYAQRMAGGTWGGGIEMAALTRMRNVNVHVYEKCREGYRRISAFDCPNARKTICVLYQGRMHYDAIVI